MRERLERKDTFEEKTEVSRWRLLSFSLNKGCSLLKTEEQKGL